MAGQMGDMFHRVEAELRRSALAAATTQPRFLDIAAPMVTTTTTTTTAAEGAGGSQ